MAASSTRARKAPRRKRNRYLVRGKWIRVEYFDGYRLRHAQPDDIDIMLWRGDGSPFSGVLERDTLYIDKPHVAETDFFVKIYEIETMRKWTRRGDDRRLPPYKEKREYLKRMLCTPGHVPESDYVVRREWDEEHQLNIWIVDGAVVRKRFDPHFTHGGHDLVYGSYITMPRTVWIDVHQDERETPFTRMHEIGERGKMERSGWSYDYAHAHAIQLEMEARFQEYLIEVPAPELPAPLAVTPIEQSDVGCGPTGLKMLLDHDRIVREDGQPYTEEDLIKLCECDPVLGTDHAPMVRAAQAILGTSRVLHGENAGIEDLRTLVLKERRPVLVGWWNGPHRAPEEVQADPELDEGHYSVVRHVTRSHVWLADSYIAALDGPGTLKIRIREFLERWYDLDGNPSENDPGYRLVRGWYLALNPDGKELRIPSQP